jgi:hypothetical protein
MFERMYMYVCICMYVCMCWFMAYMPASDRQQIHLCMYVCMYVCTHTYVCMYAYVCMYVCADSWHIGQQAIVNRSTYVCMYMYVCICMYVYADSWHICQQAIVNRSAYSCKLMTHSWYLVENICSVRNVYAHMHFVRAKKTYSLDIEHTWMCTWMYTPAYFIYIQASTQCIHAYNIMHFQ